MTRMYQRILAGGIVGFFVFILITTAWDYCRPDPDKLLFKDRAAFGENQIKKEHHPCVSLKDAYDVFAAFKVSSGNVQHDLRDLTSDFSAGSFEGNTSDFHGLSPPFENLPLQNLPIFLLYRNLRL